MSKKEKHANKNNASKLKKAIQQLSATFLRLPGEVFAIKNDVFEATRVTIVLSIHVDGYDTADHHLHVYIDSIHF